MSEYAVLTADQGTDIVYRLEVVDSDKSPKDLTNFTASAKYKKTYNSTTAYAFNVQIPAPKTQGFVDLILNGLTTSTHKSGRYVYDVEIKNGTTTERILEGIIDFTPGVTYSDSA